MPTLTSLRPSRRVVAVLLAMLPPLAWWLSTIGLAVLVAVLVGLVALDVALVVLIPVVEREEARAVTVEAAPVDPLEVLAEPAEVAHPAAAARKRAALDTATAILADADLDAELAALVAVEADRVDVTADPAPTQDLDELWSALEDEPTEET